MKHEDEDPRSEHQSTARSESAVDENVTRLEEEGEADEPDAPTAEEENVGMNTVMDASPLFGVQEDESGRQ